MLTSGNARNFANALWGTVNHTRKTNRKGAFYFDCAGHGGFVIDDATLQPEERAQFKRYLSSWQCTQYIDTAGKVRAFVHSEGSRRTRVVTGYVTRRCFDVWVAEEDCDWAAVILFSSIRLKNDPHSLAEARRTFDHWLRERAA